jgi:hypothetical protein
LYNERPSFAAAHGAAIAVSRSAVIDEKVAEQRLKDVDRRSKVAWDNYIKLYGLASSPREDPPLDSEPLAVPSPWRTADEGEGDGSPQHVGDTMEGVESEEGGNTEAFDGAGEEVTMDDS